jgi:signal transduction histidine kinase
MSARASLRWWWVGLGVSVATLAGLWIAELTVDLPRVTTLQSLIPGTLIPASWMAAGLISWRARPRSQVGPLMVLVGCLYPWNPLSFLAGDWAQWLFLMFGNVSTVIFVHVVLVFPSGPLTRPARVALGFGWTALLIGAISVAVKPESERCPVCPANPLPTAGYPELSDVLWDLAALIALPGAILTAVILVSRWHRASAPARRALAPMLWGTFQYAVVDIYWIAIGRFADGRPGTLASYSWGLIPIGVMIGMLRTRQHRSVVADLMVELGAAPQPAALRDLLARALGDPSLELAFWLPDRRGYVDADGSAVELPAGDARRRVSILRYDGEPLAALVYDPALLEDPKLLEAVSAAARLALQNSRLQAELRARLLEVRESRARLVAATDAERRRIERNLHDGAQQTLLGLRLAVRLARNRGDGDPRLLDAQLAEIDGELQAAVEELRALARGVHPAVLTDEGLEPALAALARRATVPTAVRCDCPGRLPAPVETAAYYVAAEALANVHKHAQATTAHIAVAMTDTHASIEVSDDGRGGADPLGGGLRGLRDRVEALDGTLRIESHDGAGTRVRAEIPCG